MNPVTIYTTRLCPSCMSAKALLSRRDIPFAEIDVTGDPEARQALAVQAAGRATVPQIFIGGHHVGGRDDLYALDEAGRLDPLLSA